MRISDWSSDVCSSDLSSWTLPWGLEGCKQGEPMLVSRLSLANGACYVAHFRRPLPIAPGDRRRVHRQVAKATRGKRKRQLLHQRLPSARSEEHTSELQSLMRTSYAVFCLTKKKKHHT